MTSNSNDQYVKLRNNDDPWFKVYDNGVWYKVPNTKMRLKRRWFFSTPNYAIFNQANSQQLSEQNQQFTGLQSKLEFFLNRWEQRIKNNIQGDCNDVLGSVDFAGKTKFLQHYQQTVRTQPARSRWPLAKPSLLSRFFTTRIFDNNGNYLDVKSDKLGVWKINQTELSDIFRGYLPRFEMSEAEILADIKEELTNLDLQLSLDQHDLTQRIKELGVAQQNLAQFQTTISQKKVELKTANNELNQNLTAAEPTPQTTNLELTGIDSQIQELKNQLKTLETAKEQLKNVNSDSSVSTPDSKVSVPPKPETAKEASDPANTESVDDVSTETKTENEQPTTTANIQPDDKKETTPIKEKEKNGAKSDFASASTNPTSEDVTDQLKSISKEPDEVVPQTKTSPDQTEPTIDAKSVTVILDPDEQEVSKQRIENASTSKALKTDPKTGDQVVKDDQKADDQAVAGDHKIPKDDQEKTTSTTSKNKNLHPKSETEINEEDDISKSDTNSEQITSTDQQETDKSKTTEDAQSTDNPDEDLDHSDSSTELIDETSTESHNPKTIEKIEDQADSKTKNSETNNDLNLTNYNSDDHSIANEEDDDTSLVLDASEVESETVTKEATEKTKNDSEEMVSIEKEKDKSNQDVDPSESKKPQKIRKMKR